VRETKETKDFVKLRNSEADRVRCGKKHFEALDVNFDVVVNARDV
jgi:type III restriction enzyme